MSLSKNHLSDDQLVELCQKGNLDSFSFLYERYIDAIYRFVYMKVFETPLAEDITSDIFFKVLNKINSYELDWKASFKTWIYTIAQNTVIDFYRTKKKSHDIEEIIETASQENDFWQEIDNKDKLRKILAFLDTQSEKTKEIVVMRFWDDLSFKEISQITGESVDNCKKIVSRTLKKMDITYFLILLTLIFTKL